MNSELMQPDRFKTWSQLRFGSLLVKGGEDDTYSGINPLKNAYILIYIMDTTNLLYNRVGQFLFMVPISCNIDWMLIFSQQMDLLCSAELPPGGQQTAWMTCHSADLCTWNSLSITEKMIREKTQSNNQLMSVATENSDPSKCQMTPKLYT